MPTGSAHHSNSIVKLLILGDAKSGKTTSLASLVAAGYHLRILDLDNLLDPLIGKVREISPDLLDNIHYITIRDKYIASPGGMKIDGTPKAWISILNTLNHWKCVEPDGTTTDLGPPSTWPDNWVLVIDSLSRLCDAAYDFHESVIPKSKNGGDFDGRAVYGNAQDDVEKQLAGLTAKYFTCNVIVICHGVYVDLPDGTKKIFPQGVGQKLSPKIPQYFPNYIRVTNSAIGKRNFQLVSDAMISLSTARPSAMPKEGFDTSDGLARIFSILRQQGPEPSPDLATPQPPPSTPRPSPLRRP